MKNARVLAGAMLSLVQRYEESESEYQEEKIRDKATILGLRNQN